MWQLIDPRVLASARAFALEWIDALYPPLCALCSARDLGDGLGCSAHRLPLGLDGPRCGRCARALPRAIADGERCSECRTRAPGYERLVALADYRAQPAIQDWILPLKYGRRPDLARTLGGALGARWLAEFDARSRARRGAPSRPERSIAQRPVAERSIAERAIAERAVAERSIAESSIAERSIAESSIAEHAAPPGRTLAEDPGASNEGDERSSALFVPVPLHGLRRLERGYDQALLVARAAGEMAGVRVSRALRRTRATAVQGAPGSPSRTANVDSAFAPAPFAAKRVHGFQVWIVDDVVTSGATVTECARVLRRMGAASVSVLALARASS